MDLIELRDYQLKAADKAISALLDWGGYGLFMEQRTGKTATSIYVMGKVGVKKLLVICPKRAIPVWRKEIPRIPVLEAQVDIINFEQVWRQESELLTKKYDGMIIDESHRIKERGSKQSKSCWKLARVIRNRLILTGTPRGNGEEDLYSQLKVVDPTLWPTWKMFEARYLITQVMDLPGRPMFRTIVGYRNLDEIEQILLKYSHRITRAEIEKPKPIKIKKYWIELTSENRAHYKSLEKKLKTVVNGKKVTTPVVLTNGLRLHQLCGGFLTSDDGEVHKVGTEKLDALAKILKGLTTPVVVVSRYIAEIDSILSLGKSLGITTQEISGRQQYDPDMRPQLTVLQVQSGLSIDLSYSTDLIIFSQDHSFLNFSQFKDRIVKLFGKAPTYHYLLVKNSVDELIYASVFEKRKLSEVLLSIYKGATP